MALNQEIHRRRRDDLGISTAALGEITGVHRNRLGLYLNGTAQLSNTEILKVEETLNELDLLVLAAAPFHPSFQSVERTKDLLARMRAGEFNNKIQKSEEQQ
jgi:predicted transcriptional regulator